VSEVERFCVCGFPFNSSEMPEHDHYEQMRRNADVSEHLGGYIVGATQPRSFPTSGPGSSNTRELSRCWTLDAERVRPWTTSTS